MTLSTKNLYSKISLISETSGVIKLPEGDYEIVARVPNNSEGRYFIISSFSGAPHVFILSGSETNDIGLFLKPLHNQGFVSYEFDDKLDSESIIHSLHFLSALQKNVLSSIANDYISHSLNKFYEIKSSSFKRFNLPTASRFSSLGSLIGSDDLQQCLKEYGLLNENYQSVETSFNTLAYAHSAAYKLSGEYVRFALQKERESLETLAAAETQNYSSAIDNLEQLFNHHSDAEDPTGKLSSFSSKIEYLCKLNQIDTRNMSVVGELVDNSVEQYIAKAGDIMGFRYRKVCLKDGWQYKSHGHMLVIDDHGKSFVAEEYNPSQYRLLPEERDMDLSSIFSQITLAYTFNKALPRDITSNQLLRFAFTGKRGDLLFVLLTAISATLLGFIPPIVLGELLNNAVPATDLRMTYEFGALLFIISIGVSLFDLSKSICQARLETLINTNVQTALWDRVLRIKPVFFGKYNAGILLDKIMAISSIRQLMTGAATEAILDGMFALLHFGLMYMYSPELTGVALWIVLFIVLVTVVHRILITKSVNGLIQTESALQGFGSEIVSGIEKVKTSGFQPRLFRRYTKLYAERTAFSHSVETIKDSQSAFSILFQPLSTVILYWILVGALFNPEKSSITLGAYFAFSSSFGVLLASTTELSSLVTETLGDVSALLLHAKDVIEAPLESQDGEYVAMKNPSITFQNVTFGYNDLQPIFKDLSFEIPAGSSLAVIGSSGSGKSTIAKLILGFEEPTSGSIIISGYDTGKVNIKSLRSSMSAVLQNSVPSAGSIWDFITSGIHVSPSIVSEITAAINLDDLINSLPMGYHTILSENGTNFSLAQQSQFLIARALISRPRILILDDLLSSLSSEDTDSILSYLHQCGLTVIIIGQSYEVALKANSMMVLENSDVSIGSADSLKASSQFLTRLASLS